MARDDSDKFRVRPGRVRSGGTRLNPKAQPFLKQVQIAVRKAGGNPSRIGGSRLPSGRNGKGSGRFNARGRGAKVMASLARDGGGWQSDAGGSFRSRRVIVKARVVKLNPQRAPRGPKMRGLASKAVAAHLRYLERDGVTREGEKGRVYSSFEDEADGKAFVERGREDRHQFRFIVAPEDSTEMPDLRGFTRDLMRQMEIDLDTRLDWIAVDHHNTGHPHTHILVRGVTDDSKILNIAGDYIAHGIRHRASDLITRELGHQSEIELQTKLANEVTAERLTRLDKALLSEQREAGIIDLRRGEGVSYLVRQNRALMIGRVKQLERYGLASEAEPGRWVLSGKTETTLKELGERNDIIKTVHRALSDQGLADERGVGQYALHRSSISQTVVGHVLAKGLAGDEMSERVFLVVDGVDGRVHHLEFADASRVEEVRRGMIVEAAPPTSGSRSADRNIAINAEESNGIYRPSRHLARIRDSFDRQGKDPESFVRFHVRRLEALRRAGHVERLDEDHWRVPNDIVERGQSYDLAQGGNLPQLRTLSTIELERQITNDGATWLDRELIARDPIPTKDLGFGREVRQALSRRAERLVEMGYAVAKDGKTTISRTSIATLERKEIERVGQEMASSLGRTFQPVKGGDYVTGALVGSANLSSGRFAMLEVLSADGGLGFALVPWQPVLDKRIGQHVSGIMLENGGVDWSLGRKRGLGL